MPGSAAEQRAQRIAAATAQPFDILVIGGGIHGAFVAREATRLGLTVLLLEQGDFASGTSSRSSKLLHGNIRYLQQGELGLVFEAVGERAVLCAMAPHLTRPLTINFPIISGLTPPAWQIRAGLITYDLFSRANRFLRGRDTISFEQHSCHAANSRESAILHSWGLQFSKLFSFADAQMDDARLVIELVLDASNLGAITLNHAAVANVSKERGMWQVSWHSYGDPQLYRSTARMVINTSGIINEKLAPEFGSAGVAADRLSDHVVYSRGTHLLFNAPCPVPLILPTREIGRYYFVLPYFCNGQELTLVGTTDRFTPAMVNDPQSSKSEHQELLDLLARDLPGCGLNAETLYQSYCGIRTMYSNGQREPLSGQSSRLSRRHHWAHGAGYWALVGGKYTTARTTALEVIRSIARELKLDTNRIEGLRILPLPHSRGFKQLDRTAIQQIINDEQPLLVEDILRRKVNVALLPGAGMDLAPLVAQELANAGLLMGTKIDEAVDHYCSRWKFSP